jgi:PAS domain S-box-containing protein
MPKAPLPPNEAGRLNALCHYQILDTEPEAAFDDLSHMAAHICGTPIALISLIDRERQWFKSKVGLDVTETPRSLAFCSHVILQSEIFIVRDARIDHRFADHPAVLNEPYVQFYAGVPLMTPEGYAIGTICVVDFVPHDLTADQISALTALSRQVVTQLELRRKVTELEHLSQQHTTVEASLRESEERFRAIANSASVLIWVDDAKKQAVFFNQTWLDFTGRSLEQELGTGWETSVYPEDLQQCLDNYDKAFDAQLPYTIEYRLRRADGEYRWMLESGVPRFLANGTFAGLTGSCIDHHDRKIAEENRQLLQTVTQAIASSQDFHSALGMALEKVCEATHWDFGEAWIPNLNQNVMECSSAWYSKTKDLLEFRQQSKTFTFPPGVGIPGRVWVSKQPEWHQDVSRETNQSYLRAHIASEIGLKAALGIPLLANDDVITVLVFYMFEAREEDKRLIDLISASTELGLFIQRKQAEEEIRKSLDKERELNQLKSNFISIVSHEFRTPLTSIVMSTELLNKYGLQQTEEKKQIYFDRIRSAVRRMDQLIDDVLLIGQGEGGKLDFNPKLIDLKQFCQELVEDLQLSLSDKHTIRFACDGDFCRAYVDIKLLHHILNNLLCNAVKYSPTGGVVRFTLDACNELARFQIQDSGIGIPPADQQHLFELFQRATNVSTIPGTGLGLAIVKQCVDLHGGEITVQSAVNQGSTFIVQLPMQPQET